MSQLKDLDRESQLIKDFSGLVKANQEVAVMQIGHLRLQVQRDRDFAAGLIEVFRQVRSASQLDENIKFKYHQGLVLVSSQKRLSGGVNISSIRAFSREIVKKPDIPVTVIGRTGRDRIRALHPDLDLTYFDHPETDDEIASIIRHLLNFRQLTVLHPKYINVVQQTPTEEKLGQGLSQISDQPSKKSKKRPDPSRQYIFEPSLDEVNRAFSGQIFSLITQALLVESDLALVGSRITSMQAAADHLDKEYYLLNKERNRLRKRIKNSKQRQTLAGRTLWS